MAAENVRFFLWIGAGHTLYLDLNSTIFMGLCMKAADDFFNGMKNRKIDNSMIIAYHDELLATGIPHNQVLRTLYTSLHVLYVLRFKKDSLAHRAAAYRLQWVLNIPVADLAQMIRIPALPEIPKKISDALNMAAHEIASGKSMRQAEQTTGIDHHLMSQYGLTSDRPVGWPSAPEGQLAVARQLGKEGRSQRFISEATSIERPTLRRREIGTRGPRNPGRKPRVQTLRIVSLNKVL